MVTLHKNEFNYADDKKMAYLTAGPEDGPLLVFIHGFPAIALGWKPQLYAFASLGFLVVAPDMPGSGDSSARKVIEDYTLESINKGMVALLEHLGRDEAVWIGHDWGCGAVWTFATHYPEKCVAVAGLAVPFRSVELGFEELLKTVDRKLYPVDQYPFGQWSYQNFYQTEFEKGTAWFDMDVASVIRMMYVRGRPAEYGQRAPTCNVTKDGGWAGGIAKPKPEWKTIPISRTVLDEELYNELVASKEKNGFWGAVAWYYNNGESNRAYSFNKWKHQGYLHMPVLFVHAKWDTICDTSNDKFCRAMRKYCTDLTECAIEAGHWVAAERPAETNAAIARWLLEKLKRYWPGFWTSAHASSRL